MALNPPASPVPTARSHASLWQSHRQAAPKPLKKLGSAPAPGVAVDALARRREQRSASLDSFFLYQPPPGVPALEGGKPGTFRFQFILHPPASRCLTTHQLGAGRGRHRHGRERRRRPDGRQACQACPAGARGPSQEKSCKGGELPAARRDEESPEDQWNDMTK